MVYAYSQNNDLTNVLKYYSLGVGYFKNRVENFSKIVGVESTLHVVRNSSQPDIDTVEHAAEIGAELAAEMELLEKMTALAIKSALKHRDDTLELAYSIIQKYVHLLSKLAVVYTHQRKRQSGNPEGIEMKNDVLAGNICLYKIEAINAIFSTSSDSSKDEYSFKDFCVGRTGDLGSGAVFTRGFIHILMWMLLEDNRLKRAIDVGILLGGHSGYEKYGGENNNTDYKEVQLERRRQNFRFHTKLNSLVAKIIASPAQSSLPPQLRVEEGTCAHRSVDIDGGGRHHHENGTGYEAAAINPVLVYEHRDAITNLIRYFIYKKHNTATELVGALSLFLDFYRLTTTNSVGESTKNTQEDSAQEQPQTNEKVREHEEWFYELNCSTTNLLLYRIGFELARSNKYKSIRHYFTTTMRSKLGNIYLDGNSNDSDSMEFVNDDMIGGKRAKLAKDCENNAIFQEFVGAIKAIGYRSTYSSIDNDNSKASGQSTGINGIGNGVDTKKLDELCLYLKDFHNTYFADKLDRIFNHFTSEISKTGGESVTAVDNPASNSTSTSTITTVSQLLLDINASSSKCDSKTDSGASAGEIEMVELFEYYKDAHLLFSPSPEFGDNTNIYNNTHYNTKTSSISGIHRSGSEESDELNDNLMNLYKCLPCIIRAFVMVGDLKSAILVFLDYKKYHLIATFLSLRKYPTSIVNISNSNSNSNGNSNRNSNTNSNFSNHYSHTDTEKVVGNSYDSELNHREHEHSYRHNISILESLKSRLKSTNVESNTNKNIFGLFFFLPLDKQ
ncbi:hypothetical protein AX774_g1135 [Zancudomyces culisetae]|uniref:Uncharacterized protein n=1 Tax=Zancudomyces culisetae TaxID=1213189 RepID=A0A1R1PWM9_ZANCU|nr:hypothetical protein AX774_g1135 [Zancudomyces culisetae]|eukprot:OMH85329.1 hypothetical protein AX774_g1135 [Zancudomyces culisetae]